MEGVGKRVGLWGRDMREGKERCGGEKKCGGKVRESIWDEREGCGEGEGRGMGGKGRCRV